MLCIFQHVSNLYRAHYCTNLILSYELISYSFSLNCPLWSIPHLLPSSSLFLALGVTRWVGSWWDLEVECLNSILLTPCFAVVQGLSVLLCLVFVDFWHLGLPSCSLSNSANNSGESGLKFSSFQDSLTKNVFSFFRSVGNTSSGAKATTWIWKVKVNRKKWGLK